MGHVASKGLGVSWVEKGLILDSGPCQPRTTCQTPHFVMRCLPPTIIPTLLGCLLSHSGHPGIPCPCPFPGNS